MVSNSSKFITDDTALAAYLVSLGFKIISVDLTPNRITQFTFEHNGESIDKARDDFEMGIATGNIVIFFRAYKKLLNEAIRKSRDNYDSRS